MDALKALAQAGKAAITVATQMVGLLTGGSASPAPRAPGAGGGGGGGGGGGAGGGGGGGGLRSAWA